MLRKLFKKNRTSGFTLVEALVAVSIFTLSVLAMLVSLGQGLSNIDYAKKKLIAEYLAQEGIEYVRNLRDTQVLYSVDPTTGWANFNSNLSNVTCYSANGCYFLDLPSSAFSNPNMPMAGIGILPCTETNGACPPLNYDNVTGVYGYSSGTNSGFIRKIQSQQINANETKISSTVFWNQGSGAYNITFSETLFRWVE